jgi:hypothetical protein
MKARANIIFIALLVLVTGCSKSSDHETQASVSTAAQAASVPTTSNGQKPYGNLARFKGKAPDELLKDEEIGKAIRAIVPQEKFKCMNEIFNYMADLDVDNDGAVTASMYGSRADNFMKVFLSVMPNGAINIVLQCAPPTQPDENYLFYTNEGIKATTPKAVLDWMYTVNNDGNIIRKSDGKTLVEIAYSDFLQSRLAGAAKSNQPIAAATVNSQTSPLVGDWTCQSTKSNGTSYSSAFRFAPDGGFAYADPQSQMIGTYQPNGVNANIQVEQVVMGGHSSASNMTMTINFTSSNPGQLKFEMTLTKLNKTISNNCVTKVVAAVTPAPKVNVCDINPAACASIERNNDIRSQIQDQRCEILQRQLSGTPGGDYQLQKAGCQ